MKAIIEPQMDALKSSDLAALLAEENGPCISIYLPTHRVWTESTQDPIRLKNLVRQALADLLETGMSESEAGDLLQPASQLLGDDRFWRTLSDGLALFISPENFYSYRLPIPFDELVVVNDSFLVKPLLPLLSDDGRFHVLTLGLNEIHLWTGTRYSIAETALPDTPTSLADIMKYDVYQSQQQFHSGASRTTKSGDRAAMFHGQGDAADDAKMNKRITEFFRQVDNGVCKALANEQTPLIVAGLDHLRGLYKSVNHYTHLVDDGISVNPSDLSVDDLHSRAWKIVEPQFKQEHLEARTAYERLSSVAPERATDNLDDVVAAAYFHRVKVLFVRDDAHVWGRFDPQSQEIERHGSARSGDQDLLDIAVANTLRNAGNVYVEDADGMPSDSDVAAIFRY